MAPPTSASAILSRSAVVLCGRQIVHAPAGVRRTIFCHSSRRTIAVGPWGTILMQKFEPCCPSQPVRSPTIVFAGKRLTSLNQPRQRRAMEHKLTGYPSSC